ncbi:MAG: N-acetylmuramoyl-L-alanine amidase [Oscillospiraceae bacterium]|nr:N-acetylmuramoyl-L-alanine amidase [Oscillospiraceae bacterium]
MPTVFLSPSTQEWNPYVTENKNEEMVMNQLADAMEPYLRSSAITFVRNDPSRNVAGAIADSNAGEFDVHLALHSNAAPEQFAGMLRGIDIYYAPSSYDSELLATIIANNLQRIYPVAGQVIARPTNSLGEVLRTRAVAVLAELGYHDNAEDAHWLQNNLEQIAQNLVLSLTDYFGIPYISATDPFYGTVDTGGSRLNLRSYPALSGQILTQIPDETQLIFNGETNGWLVTTYNGRTGYVSSEFIKL